MGVISEALALAVQRGMVRPAFFLRIETTPNVTRACSVIGRRFLPADATEPVEGAAYLGVGFMQSLPEFEALFLGESQALSFTLPGVDARALDLVDQAAGDIEGLPVQFGVALMDSQNRIATPVWWDFEGEVETCEWSDAQGGEDGATRTRSITLNLVGGFSDRRFRTLQSWAPTDQALRSPTDLGLNHVPAYEAGATADWPLK